MGKEVIRKENVKKYIHTPIKPKNVATNFVAQNMPLAAMFLRNKAVAWACLFFTIQSYLTEPLIKDTSDDSQPAGFRFLFALIALGTSYLDLIFPQSTPAALGAAIANNAATTAVVEAVETAATSK